MIKIQNSKPSSILLDVVGLEGVTFSYENLNWALNEVKRRYYSDFIDKFSVGFDKERLEDFLKERDKNLSKMSRDLKVGKYKFSPFIERKIPKSHKKALILCQGCLRDVIVQIALNRVLTDKLQGYYSRGLYSGRKKGGSYNVHNLVKTVYKFHKEAKYSAVKLDIEDYFNQIDRKILSRQIKGLFGARSKSSSVILSYINSSRVDKGRIVKRDKGIPIGSHLASLLSNLYLTEFDGLMCKKAMFYARYADDIFIIDKNRLKADELLLLVKKELGRYSLKVNKDKLKIIKPGESFEYLGFEFRDGNIYIRAKSIQKFKNKIRSCMSRRKFQKLKNIKCAECLREEQKLLLAELILDINKLITGTHFKSWVRYFAKATFSDQFKELDLWIKDKLRQKLTGHWSKKNYRKFSNDFFRRLALKSLVREYYGWRERWRNFTKPLRSRIASVESLEKALQYYLTRRNLAKNKEVQSFLLEKKENLENIHRKLLKGEYKFHKPLRKEVKRFDTKEKRYIFTSCIEDRIVQRAIINVVPSYFNEAISENVYSYRKGSSVLKAISYVIRLIRNCPDELIFKSDFENFHENVDLRILRKQVRTLLTEFPEVLGVFESLLDSLSKVGFLPKGMPLTNFLLNVYLKEFDKTVSQEFDAYIRYADDFLVVPYANSKKDEVRSFIEEEGAKLGLKLKEEKSKFVQKGCFEFLGYKFSLQDNLKIGLSKFTIIRLKRKIKRLTAKRKFSKVNTKNYVESSEIRSLIKRINYFFSTKKKSSWSKYYCRVNDFDKVREIDSWILDRVRLLITKKTNLKNRSLIPSANIRRMGLVSMATWLYRAKRLMYNKLAMCHIVQHD